MKVLRQIWEELVGLFVDADPAAVRGVLGSVRIDLLQFHGNETPQQCRRYHRPYVKAIHMQPGVNLTEKARLYADAEGLLLDTQVANVAGGSGQPFDWSLVPAGLGKPIILAGGLTPENVAAAIQKVHPFAVDVSSGVELAKGIKDAAKISAFIEAVRKA